MAQAPVWRRHRVAVMVAIWATACAVMLALHARGIATLAFPDGDDELRLLEVRDWLGGQSFWDVSQHRMNPPFGAPMHWSRLVDMPIALIELLLRPLLGAARAETAAAVIVPLLTLGVVMAAAGAIARRLAGEGAGLIAFAMTAACLSTTMQLQPLRVDHHGWEIAFGLVAVAAILGRDRRAGWIAGIAIAVALQISLEMLPFAAALGGVLALEWCLEPSDQRRVRLLGYGVALAIAETLLFAVLRLPGDAIAHCDAISPPHLLALAIAATGVVVMVRFAPPTRVLRFAALGATAGLAAAAFHAIPPHCGLDAFGELEPIVKRYWLEQVSEGLPVWKQSALVAAGAIGFPLVGLICTMFAWRQSEDRAPWMRYGLLLAAATLVAVGVQRAGGLANALALPAAAWAIVRLVRQAQASGSAGVRVLGTVGVLCALSPFAPVALASLATPTTPAVATPPSPACATTANMRRLRALPTGRMLAAIDIAPEILLQTPHAVLASAHHRNHAAIADLLRAFLGSDATARAVIARHGLDYVVICPDQAEIGVYRSVSPDGFAAHLASGRAPGWLRPVALRGSPARVWKVANVSP